MKRWLPLIVLMLAACGGEAERAEISRASDIEPAAGLSYDQFRSHDMNNGADSLAAQKRFLALDRDNNGRLDPNEIGGN